MTWSNISRGKVSIRCGHNETLCSKVFSISAEHFPCSNAPLVNIMFHHDYSDAHTGNLPRPSSPWS